MSFFEAMYAEGLFEVPMLVVEEAVGAECSEALPPLLVADVSTLQAAEGVTAEGSRSMGVVGGTL